MQSTLVSMGNGGLSLSEFTMRMDTAFLIEDDRIELMTWPETSEGLTNALVSTLKITRSSMRLLTPNLRGLAWQKRCLFKSVFVV